MYTTCIYIYIYGRRNGTEGKRGNGKTKEERKEGRTKEGRKGGRKEATQTHPPTYAHTTGEILSPIKQQQTCLICGLLVIIFRISSGFCIML